METLFLEHMNENALGIFHVGYTSRACYEILYPAGVLDREVDFLP